MILSYRNTFHIHNTSFSFLLHFPYIIFLAANLNYLEIYIDEFNDKGIQIANAFLDVMRCKLTELCADSTDTFASVFDNSHIETEQYYMNILSEDLKPIVSDLRNIHMKDSNTASDIDY